MVVWRVFNQEIENRWSNQVETWSAIVHIHKCIHWDTRTILQDRKSDISNITHLWGVSMKEHDDRFGLTFAGYWLALWLGFSDGVIYENRGLCYSGICIVAFGPKRTITVTGNLFNHNNDLFHTLMPCLSMIRVQKTLTCVCPCMVYMKSFITDKTFLINVINCFFLISYQ